MSSPRSSSPSARPADRPIDQRPSSPLSSSPKPETTTAPQIPSPSPSPTGVSIPRVTEPTSSTAPSLTTSEPPSAKPPPPDPTSRPNDSPLARTTTPLSTTTTLVPASRPLALLPPRPPDRTPSPAPPPTADIVSVFDPASAGGGGPLVRIATAHSQREMARERSRSGTSQRPALFALTRARERDVEPAGVFDDGEGSVKSGRSRSVRSAKSGRSRDSREDRRCCCQPGGEDNEKETKSEKECHCQQGDEEKGKEVEEETPGETYVYPDGGYGWVVVGCCMTLCALTNGWGMSYGVFQEVSHCVLQVQQVAVPHSSQLSGADGSTTPRTPSQPPHPRSSVWQAARRASSCVTYSS